MQRLYREGVKPMGTPVPLYNTGYGWMWSDGVIRASDSYSEL
nr:MAG TPA: hypothetical protein [Caudoviricetes sp.]